MSSSVSQGLQSCLEVVESRFLRLKLVPPLINYTRPYNEGANTTNNKNIGNDCKAIANRNADMGGWSSLRSLSDAKAPTEDDKVYVHPLVKRSRLSGKSLEMCTEQLGSETGSEVSDCSDDISLETRIVACGIIPSKPRECSSKRKMSHGSSFPPPLTSISGSNGVRVKSHRENGRLVLEAVSFPPCHSYFRAERTDGRLRLSLKDPVLDDEEQNDGEEVEIQVEEDEFYGETENKEGNKGNVGGETETGKLPMPSNCKESGRGHKGGLLNWKSFLVAT
ncbi:Mitochondrial Rho GTPase [Hibiscus syriacus]|uniref:Mitochondrial Rho GTPase n=1 Tax=Hibiscus syriacus TaxID=106335 RepID=A0A6A2YQF4_HIBSY|nr:protein FANTASTIC FOUR 3-like [Hibiscus syriacus]KAE8681590.1 Mitochondrial Rho GTPase [Hibiscus syriacus]